MDDVKFRLKNIAFGKQDDIESNAPYHKFAQKAGLATHHIQSTNATSVGLVVPKTESESLGWTSDIDVDL